MPSGPTSVRPLARSPLFAAVGLSLAVGLGTVLGTADSATIADALSGKWLTRSYAETQQGHTVAIAALEHSVGNVARDIDFVASRVGASIRRNEDQSSDRFAHLDAEIAALKEKLLGIQLTQLISSRTDAPLGSPVTASEVGGLRSSLFELSSAHHNSVAAITRRLDRIEVKIGLSTDCLADPRRGRAQGRTPHREGEKAPPSAGRRPGVIHGAARPRAPVQHQAGEPAARAAAPEQTARLTSRLSRPDKISCGGSRHSIFARFCAIHKEPDDYGVTDGARRSCAWPHLPVAARGLRAGRGASRKA